MSVIWSNATVVLICHSTYLHKLYNSIPESSPLCESCNRYKIFHIMSPFVKYGQQSVDSKILTDASPNEEAYMVQRLFNEFMTSTSANELPYFDNTGCSTSQHSQNETAVRVANTILKETDVPYSSFNGGNTNDTPITVELHSNTYFIPPACRFYCNDVIEVTKKLSTAGEMYDVIVMDPPWWNKHVRRKNDHSVLLGYKLLRYTIDLAKIPVDRILSPDGLVVVWCTNSEQQMKCLVEQVFPSWKVKYTATWYWTKVTGTGQPICSFSPVSGKKQPFERIVFGIREGRDGKYKNPKDKKIIISIPSSIHSHKPPLTDVLSDCIPPDGNFLELFARYLLPKWTSIGNEVLKLQHKSVFR